MSWPSWATVLIIIIVLTLLAMFLPWDKIYNRIRKDNWNPKINSNTKNKHKKNKLDQSLEIESKINDFEKISKKNEDIDHRYFGIYNYFGAKSSIRWETLVYVKPKKDSCRLCQSFENKVLSLDNMSKNYITMSEAISRGYHHLGCTHKDINFYPNETNIVQNPFTKKQQSEAYNLKLKQFKFENKLRLHYYHEQNALNLQEQKKAQRDHKKILEQYKIWLKKHNLKRNKKREQVLDNEIII